MQASHPTSTVLVQRVDPYAEPDTDELRALVRAAGCRVDGELTQSRTEDPEYHIGSGKVEELTTLVAKTDADLIVFDGRLGPYQTYNIGLELPDGVDVIDRYRLILRIFADRADTRKAQLQVELAELRYELPRVDAKVSLAKRDERPGFMGLGDYDESREQDIKQRISRIRTELDQIAATEEERRDQRRDDGFDLVALAGYTNAGKSTLFQRLAADLEVGENDDLHPDLDPTAEAHDHLFTTLGTTTRRMDHPRRDVLLTDTVGFISDLPHWLVNSFRSTLDSAYRADLVLLVVDATDPVPEMREKMVTSYDTLTSRNQARLLTVFTKADAVSDAELAQKRDALEDIAHNPVIVSATEGTGIDTLAERIEMLLPPLEEERLRLPLSDDAMSLVSWIYDHGHVQSEEYESNAVTLTFEAQPAIIDQARAKAESLPHPESPTPPD